MSNTHRSLLRKLQYIQMLWMRTNEYCRNKLTTLSSTALRLALAQAPSPTKIPVFDGRRVEQSHLCGSLA
jgi:hypothetical protein